MATVKTAEERADEVLHYLGFRRMESTVIRSAGHDPSAVKVDFYELAKEYLVGQFKAAAGVEGPWEPSEDGEVWIHDFFAWARIAYGMKWGSDLPAWTTALLRKGFRAGWRRAIMAARRRVAKENANRLAARAGFG